MPYHLCLVLALVVTLVAAVSDWKTGKIPDRLTLGALAAAPLLHALFSYADDATAMGAIRGVAGSVLGAAAAGVLPFLLLRAGGMGGGDVKLFAAVGAITGPSFAVHVVTYAMLVALAHGLLIVARRKALRSTGRNVLALVNRPLRRPRSTEGAEKPGFVAMTTIRLASSIFLGTCMASAVLWNPAG
ncbi:MAG TPA: A24 family peptidase [Polyangiaceae bacterium]|nr:A24 family peptidase [Polyangiaceae bacterium]